MVGKIAEGGKSELANLFTGSVVKNYLDTPLSLPAHGLNHTPEYLVAEFIVDDGVKGTQRVVLRQRLFDALPTSELVSAGKRINSNENVGYEYVIIPADCINLGSLLTTESFAMGQVLAERLEDARDYLRLHQELLTTITKVYLNPLDIFAISLSTGDLYILI